MSEHERTDQPTHTDYGAAEHERRMQEGDESPGGDALNDDGSEADAMPGSGGDEGSSHGGV